MAEVAVRLGTTGTSGRIGEVTNQTMKCPGDYYFWLNPYEKKNTTNRHQAQVSKCLPARMG